MTEILWRPSSERVAHANLTAFATKLPHGAIDGPLTMQKMYRWSVENPEAFWELVWDECGVVASERGDVVLRDGHKMPDARWFPDARLNFAENLLRPCSNELAMIAEGEHRQARYVTRTELREHVAAFAAGLRELGVQQGDRVAGLLPNIPQAVIAMLAASSIGAIWSSCSPDFGVPGVLDRFQQVEPKVLISADGYHYGGKQFLASDRLSEILASLPSVEHLITVSYVSDPGSGIGIEGEITYKDLVLRHMGADLHFEQLPFDHPLFIMFSSGTTGAPKCIVHGAGGTLLQHLKEHQLHCDLKQDDRVFYFTTLGWMMWNWLVTALASESTIVLYDGSPFWPKPRRMWDMAQSERITFFGTGAKYLDALKKTNVRPKESHHLPELRTIASTGSPLLPETFDFIYDGIKEDLCVASISGGTDIVSCFVLGDPIGPVRRGEISTRGLGMAVEVFDDNGSAIVGTPGELVCTRPFPSMPVGFWNDDDGARYRKAYFDRFDNVWCHGDWVELTTSGGMIIYGRSDAVLNPGGVRIGTSEIYRQVEDHPDVLESIVIGQDWKGDVRVVLFVKLHEGVELTEDLANEIRLRIRQNTTPRHVPAKVLQAPDIPRTKSGKITELAVRDVVHGRTIKNREALANPDALDFFADLPELQTD